MEVSTKPDHRFQTGERDMDLQQVEQLIVLIRMEYL